jgi:hypothetical protein
MDFGWALAQAFGFVPLGNPLGLTMASVGLFGEASSLKTRVSRRVRCRSNAFVRLSEGVWSWLSLGRVGRERALGRFSSSLPRTSIERNPAAFERLGLLA